MQRFGNERDLCWREKKDLIDAARAQHAERHPFDIDCEMCVKIERQHADVIDEGREILQALQECLAEGEKLLKEGKL